METIPYSNGGVRVKIWMDTDIGSDIDDAVALAYLLGKPESDLIGISTVSGQARNRAMIASAICKAANAKVPIYVGVEDPILARQHQPEAQQSRILANWPHDEVFPDISAVEAMYAAIRNHPGEVTLVAVGPMTNVALLFRLHPDAPELLKDAHLMCGEFFRRLPTWGEAEWNSLCDPHASAIVYGAKNLKLRSVGLDVTLQVYMNANEVRERFTSPVLRVVSDFSKAWFDRADRMYFHDPLAAVGIFEPGVMDYARGTASVELFSVRALGRTYFDPDENGRHEVAKAVRADAFFEEYFRHTT